MLTRPKDTEPHITYIDVDPSLNKPPDEPGYKWVLHGDHWDKVLISNPNPSTDHNDVQNGGLTDVVQPNILVDGQHNLVDSLALPTDAELAEYDQGESDELIVKLHNADMKVHLQRIS